MANDKQAKRDLAGLQVAATFANKYAARVIGNNPGALQIVMRLQHRTHWYEMMQWLDVNEYHGEMLWILYKDVFHEDLYRMGDFIEYMRHSKEWNKTPFSYYPSGVTWEPWR